MKSIISYNHLAKQAKQDKAIQDIIEYCTPKQFITLQNIAMKVISYSQLSFWCSIVGIEGYPVVALWNETRQIMHDMTN